jgi:branched-chain amino acid transport system permease protein
MRTLVLRGGVAGLVLLLLVLPQMLQCCTVRPVYNQHVLDMAMIWAVLVLSLTLLSGTCGQISLGQGGFLAVGAYGTAVLSISAGVPVELAILLATLLSGLVGVAVGLPALRLEGPYLVMATLAFAGIAYGVALNWIDVTRGPQGIAGIPKPSFFGNEISTPFQFHYLLLGSLLLTIGVVLVVKRSQRGLRMRAIRDDQLAAEALGIRSATEKTVAFGVSAAIAGFAGSLLSVFVGYISPDFFTIDQSILALTMGLIGGIASVPGALLGAFGLSLTNELLRDFAQYQLIVYGLIVIIVVLIIPGGVMGAVERLLQRRSSRRSPVNDGEEREAAGRGA